MEDFQDFGAPGRHPVSGSGEPRAIFDWPAQEMQYVPQALLFTSDIANTATDFHHHAAYGILAAGHLTLEAQTYGHDIAMHIPESQGLPAGHLTLETQTFGYDTAMHITKNQDLLFPENHDVPGWNSNPTGVVTHSVRSFEKVSQRSAREHSSYMNGDGNTSSLDPLAYSEQKSSPLRICGIGNCAFRYASPEEYTRHVRDRHKGEYMCQRCAKTFTSVENLEWHASRTGHLSLACKYENCDKKFSRLDSYRRHERKHRDDAKRFPCKYCRKYRGANGFKRKDHLTQHIRNYHHIDEDNQRASWFENTWCRIDGCSHQKDFAENIGKCSAFSTSTEYIKHMRSIHDQSEFPCPQPGCDRINGKGYFRKADLRTHLRKVHGTDGSLEGDGYWS